MRQPFTPLTRESIGIAAFAGIAGVAGSFFLAGLTPSFVAGPIDAFLARTMPGVIIAFAIQTLGTLGQRLNFLTSIIIATGLLSGIAAAALVVGHRTGRPAVAIGTTAGLAWVTVTAITTDPVAALGAAIPAATVVAMGVWSRTQGSPVERRERREVITTLAAVIGLGGIASLLSNQLGPEGSTRDRERGMDGGGGSKAPDPEEVMAQYREPIEALLEEASRKSLPIEGIEPLVSDDFYEVDINSVNPALAADDHIMSLWGEIDEELTFSYADLVAQEPLHFFNTLRCVGESLNGAQMDNAIWTGIPISRLLENVTPTSNCECVMVRAADAYFEMFPIEALRRGYLVYGMNGEPLPRGHGFPVRVLIPGHWGEINVKWVTAIEFLDETVNGYWERRGWHGTGPVNTVAKLHAVNHLDGDRIEVGGHAYAGTRGIDRVEVQIDADPTWQEATLSEPLPGEDVWRQWHYEYGSPGESHSVVVRAIDGTGTVQPQERAQAFPSGPSGWVEHTVRP